MGSRMTWLEIRQSEEYRGRWVALDHCVYDAKTAKPLEGSVVDVDDDLVELCGRIRSGANKHCAILFCEEDELEPQRPSERLRSAIPG